jgi:acyl-coenzyme A thioesterase PaaI-like protein
MRTLGVVIAHLSPGEIVLDEMPFDERYTQQHGFLHTNIVTTKLNSTHN